MNTLIGIAILIGVIYGCYRWLKSTDSYEAKSEDVVSQVVEEEILPPVEDPVEAYPAARSIYEQPARSAASAIYEQPVPVVAETAPKKTRRSAKKVEAVAAPKKRRSRKAPK